jgi:hypothetical protein
LADLVEGAGQDFFGGAVALSGDGSTALIGANGDDISGNGNQGSAYIFVRQGETWSQQAKLVDLVDGKAGDYFGDSVALSHSGDTALVGASEDQIGGNAGQGSAYVFVRQLGVWSQQAKLVDLVHGGAGDNFGYAVSLGGDGSTALVGAPQNKVGGNEGQGTAYVFVRQAEAWNQQARLADLVGGSKWDSFGVSVALCGDGSTALIGILQGDVDGNQDLGSAYVFVRNGETWSQQGQLADLAGNSNDEFGTAVALSGDGRMALVGAYLDDVLFADVGGPLDQGTAHIYSLPVKPVLLSPADGQITSDDTPTLSWKPSANTAAYRLDLDGTIVDAGDATQYTPAVLSLGLHTWTVVAVDALGNESPWADVWSFRVVEPGAPTRVYLPLVRR